MTEQSPHQVSLNHPPSQRVSAWLALLLALGYPGLLQLFFWGNTGELPILVGYIAFVLAILIPWYGFFAAAQLRKGGSTQTNVRLSRYLMLLSVVPSAYCLLGVTLYLMQSNNLELPIYYGSIAVVILWQRYHRNEHQRPGSSERKSGFLPVAHGVSALLLLVFISVHLLNHLAANLGGDVHLALMEQLRHYYRHPVTESLLIALCLFQLVSGIILARFYLQGHGDIFNSAQIATGLMLLVFLSSHLLAVLVLGRIYVGVDTNWNWLVYQPGLLKDAWNVRLVSHYMTGIAALIIHLGLALRLVLKAHNKNSIAALIMGPTIIVALLLTYAIMRPLLLAS